VRLESLGTKRTHVRIDGSVYPDKITKGPRKGRTNFRKPADGTERMIIVSNAEYDAWMEEVRAQQPQSK
jgi:hypothetical protein